jgi:uncharacterized protein
MGFGIKNLSTTTLAILWLAVPLASGARAADCDASQIDLRGDWGQARFSIEVADDSRERAVGLMNRDAMARNAGMLFIYEAPQSVAFWMKNTRIPLDMIFADANGVVKTVHSNAIPQDTTPIPGGEQIQYVLEINGGLAALLGIAPGSQMKFPRIDQKTAAWPCDAQ